jgi:HD-GYP domain-containing protein (c-di-GMP phosphodiesterase class II)
MGCDIAHYHHEKWNGSGYPFGLSGVDIPLPARIIALGDAYDAMTTRRPYKEAFSHEKSKSIILEAGGKHFDPDMVDAFLAREQKFIAIQKTYEDSGHLTHIEQIMKTLAHLHELEAKRQAEQGYRI